MLIGLVYLRSFQIKILIYLVNEMLIPCHNSTSSLIRTRGFDLPDQRIPEVGSIVSKDDHCEVGALDLDLLNSAMESGSDLDRTRLHRLNTKLIAETTSLMAVLDPESKIVWINRAFRNTTSFGEKELQGRSFWHSGLFEEKNASKIQECIKEALDGAERVHSVTEIRDKMGGLHVLDIHYAVTRKQNESTENILIVADDITEQYRLRQQLMEAIDREQTRIAHDLHDGVGQLLSGIGTLTESLQGHLQEPQKQDAQRIYQLVREAIHQVRQLSHTMSPLSIQSRDLSDSLQLLADSIRQNFRLGCVTELEPDLRIADGDVVGHLFRIAQEAVNNAIRHGSPKEIRLSLRRESPAVGLMEIFNDGDPFEFKPNSGKEGIGLRVMKHRASLIEASLEVTCPSTGGVVVSCYFPLNHI